MARNHFKKLWSTILSNGVRQDSEGNWTVINSPTNKRRMEKTGSSVGGASGPSSQEWIPAKIYVTPEELEEIWDKQGVIGCEFASVWKSFGAEVTIIEALPHLIALEDESSSKQLERAFRKRGINFELGTRFKSASKSASGVSVTLEDGKTFTALLS